MPPTPPNQACQPHDGTHPLLRSVADETRALLVRLLAYASILAGVLDPLVTLSKRPGKDGAKSANRLSRRAG